MYDEIMEFFYNNEQYYLKFKDISPERKFHNRPDINAFIILDNLVPGFTDIVEAAEHDQIFLNISVEDLCNVATHDDIKDLIRCGVRYNSEFDCLCMYV